MKQFDSTHNGGMDGDDKDEDDDDNDDDVGIC